MRKSHSEHFSTAVPQKVDVVLTAANGSFVPEPDIVPPSVCVNINDVARARSSRASAGPDKRVPVRTEMGASAFVSPWGLCV
jgi:hypothetical protein